MNPSSVTLPNPNASAGTREFTTSRIRFVEHMGFLEVLSFFGEGVGAALYIFGTIAGHRLIAALGIAVVALAIVALLAHLGPRAPLAWRALTRIKTSWVSRGSLFMSIFMPLSILSLIGAELGATDGLQAGLIGAAQVFALLVIIYAGMMLRSMKAVKLWATAYVPLAFSTHSLATASIIALAIFPWIGGDESSAGWLRQSCIAFLSLAAAISVAHLLLMKRTAAIRASVERLVSGLLRIRMIVGAGVIGVIVPLAALVATSYLFGSIDTVASQIVLMIAAVCRICGDFAYRSSIVKAGAYEPIVPPPARR